MAISTTSTGQLKPSDTWGQFNNISFLVRQAMVKMQTATLVKIISCTNSGGLSPVGFVDVQPLVNQIDGANPPNSTPHSTVYGLPYQRMQGGSNAVIMDPQPGDIGLAVFASRDISKVKSTQAQANPGSYRSYDFADGMYVGGLLNGTPTQYILFALDGITIVSPTAITLQAPVINIEGSLSMSGGDATMTGMLTTTGDVISDGISLQTHTHTSESVGDPTSPPIP
jgi:hypothetical protein